jgi:hypothetical protein
MIAQYGPDDRTITKLVASVIPSPGADPTALKRWSGTRVASDPKVAEAIDDFLRSHGARMKLTAVGVIGCPHEEGEDFPEGSDCPFCPFWKGKQGTAGDDSRWDNVRQFNVEYL